MEYGDSNEKDEVWEIWRRRGFSGRTLTAPTVSFPWPRKMKATFKKLQCCPFLHVALHVSSSVHALLWGFVRLQKGCGAEAD